MKYQYTRQTLLSGFVLVAFFFFFYLWVAALFYQTTQGFIQDNPKINSAPFRGRWWSGYIDNLTVDVRGYRLSLGVIQWRYDWSSILQLMLKKDICFFLSSSNELVTTQSYACYAYGSQTTVHINDASFYITANEISNIIGFDVAGEIQGNVEKLIFDGNKVINAEGKFVWRDLMWNTGDEWLSFGRLTASVTSYEKDGFLLSKIKSEHSDINVDFLVRFSPFYFYEWQGVIELGGQDEEVLMTMLRFFSSQVKDKKFYFSGRSEF